MKCTVFIATSMDGFIARENGDIDFLDDPPEIPDEDYGYYTFMDTVDALVMGRNSYEKVQSFGIPWPYDDKPVVVLTHRDLIIPEEIANTVKTMSGTPSEIIESLAQQGANHLYIDGGITIQQFLNAGLIQRLIITRIPVIIGNGIPLFGPLEKDIKLTHIETKTFPNSITQSEYIISD